MKALVIGESCIDEYIYGKAERLAPEAPVPVLVPTRKVRTQGMAANVAANLISLGVEVEQLTNGNKILKTRYVDDKTNHLLVRVDVGDDKTSQMKPIAATHKNLDSYDMVVISDYCKGFISEDDILAICTMHDNVFVDTKKSLNECFNHVTFLKINEYEYNKSVGYFRDYPALLNKTIVTLGKIGCKLNGKIYPVSEVEVKDQVGAGDTFLAGLAYRYTITKDVDDAIAFASECASKVVSKRGTASV